MTGPGYKPSMEAELVPAHGNGDASIKCSDEYVRQLGAELDEREQSILTDAVVGQAICPKLWWFEDTPETRRLLRVKPLDVSAEVKK